MRKITIRLTKDARFRAVKPELVERAALAAFEAAGRGEIHFAPFTAGGNQYALSSRMILEVDWLPNRVPERVLRQANPIIPRRR
ncbi:MAG: hypothetical protein JJ913_15750 [Rhizobiaceae bacterium]|nr:hypothetical protein [Rhizobiaceae bacterium]